MVKRKGFSFSRFSHDEARFFSLNLSLLPLLPLFQITDSGATPDRAGPGSRPRAPHRHDGDWRQRQEQQRRRPFPPAPAADPGPASRRVAACARRRRGGAEARAARQAGDRRRLGANGAHARGFAQLAAGDIRVEAGPRGRGSRRGRARARAPPEAPLPPPPPPPPPSG